MITVVDYGVIKSTRKKISPKVTKVADIDQRRELLTLSLSKQQGIRNKMYQDRTLKTAWNKVAASEIQKGSHQNKTQVVEKIEDNLLVPSVRGFSDIAVLLI